MDVDNHICPISDLLNVVSAKWTVEILRELALGPVRTGVFLKAIPGLSMKSLQERLNALIKYGLTERTSYDEKVPRVEHSITDRGRRLFKIMSELKEIAAEVRETTCRCPLEGVDIADMECGRRGPISRA